MNFLSSAGQMLSIRDSSETLALDISALVAARLCHDLVNPLGALVNGLEVLEEDDDPEMQKFALDLIRRSAQQACARMRFGRLAFGLHGGQKIAAKEVIDVTEGLLAHEKVTVTWRNSPPSAFLSKLQARLLLNLILNAHQALPRGGHLSISFEEDKAQERRESWRAMEGNLWEGRDPAVTEEIFLPCLEATGPRATLSTQTHFLLVQEALPLRPEARQDFLEGLDTRTIQPLLTRWLARRCGLVLSIEERTDTVCIRAFHACATKERTACP